MRNDFQVMKDLDSHTKVIPRERIKNISDFAHTINSSKDIQENFTEWKLKLHENPMKIQGVQLPPEKVKVDEIIDAGEKGNYSNSKLLFKKLNFLIQIFNFSFMVKYKRNS